MNSQGFSAFLSAQTFLLGRRFRHQLRIQPMVRESSFVSCSQWWCGVVLVGGNFESLKMETWTSLERFGKITTPDIYVQCKGGTFFMNNDDWSATFSLKELSCSGTVGFGVLAVSKAVPLWWLSLGWIEQWRKAPWVLFDCTWGLYYSLFLGQ